MIPRRLATPLEHRLSRFPAVALLGPRQVGKTTLALSCHTADDALYLDLENPADRAFLVSSGDERYPKGGGIEAIGVRQLAQELAALAVA